MLLGELDEFRRASPRRVQVPRPEGKRACSQGERGAQGDGVLHAPRLLHGDPDGFRGLVGIPLHPEDVGQDVAGRGVRIEAGAANLTAPWPGRRAEEQMLQM